MLVTGAEGQVGRRLIEAFADSLKSQQLKKDANITSADDVRIAFER